MAGQKEVITQTAASPGPLIASFFLRGCGEFLSVSRYLTFVKTLCICCRNFLCQKSKKKPAINMGFAGNLGRRKFYPGICSLLFFSLWLDRFITRLAGYAKSATSLHFVLIKNFVSLSYSVSGQTEVISQTAASPGPLIASFFLRGLR